jgi:hypothetical protein
MLSDPKSLLFLLRDEKLITVAQPLQTEVGIYWDYLTAYPVDTFDKEEFLSENPQKNILVLDNSSSEASQTNIITTSDIALYVSDFKKNSQDIILNANEFIDSQGKILLDLTEPEINTILREVFRHKNKPISICLLNSIFNPLHERNLKNILVVAGYKVFLSADCIESRSIGQ